MTDTAEQTPHSPTAIATAIATASATAAAVAAEISDIKEKLEKNIQATEVITSALTTLQVTVASIMTGGNRQQGPSDPPPPGLAITAAATSTRNGILWLQQMSPDQRREIAELPPLRLRKVFSILNQYSLRISAPSAVIDTAVVRAKAFDGSSRRRQPAKRGSRRVKTESAEELGAAADTRSAGTDPEVAADAADVEEAE